MSGFFLYLTVVAAIVTGWMYFLFHSITVTFPL